MRSMALLCEPGLSSGFGANERMRWVDGGDGGIERKFVGDGRSKPSKFEKWCG